MKQFILFSVSSLSVLAVASCFEILSSNVDPLNIEVTNLKCLSEGRFPHPYDCGGYLECIRDIKGSFKRRFGSCHGAIFSSKFKSCMLSTEDYECKTSIRSARALAIDKRFSSICSEVTNGFVCADCKTLVNCVEGVAYPESCGAGDMCAEKSDFGGDVCYPSQPDDCTCSTPNEFHLDNYNPHMFFYCDNTGSDPDLYHCPEDMQFDLESKQCKNEEGLPECTETGNFATYDNCSQYYTCIFSRDGWVQKVFVCPNNLMYNENTGECEDPCNWDTGEFICQEEGRFADPLSCQHYYECIQDEGGFRQDNRQCPDGYEWDTSALLGNGHCMKDHINTCTTVKVSKCFIPEGHCSESADITSINNDELMREIRRLRKEKTEKETEIQGKAQMIEALKEMGESIAHLYLAVFEGRRRIRESYPEISLVVENDGTLTVSSSCGVDGEDTLRDTPDSIILTALDNRRLIITHRLDFEPCMNDLILKLTDALLNQEFVITNLEIIKESILQTMNLVTPKINEMENQLLNLEEEKANIASQLNQLEANLTIDVDPEVTSLPPFDENTEIPPIAHEISSQDGISITDNATPLPDSSDFPEPTDAQGSLSARTRLWSILNRGDRRIRRTVPISLIP